MLFHRSLCATLALLVLLPCTAGVDFDVVVVGAGIAGLAAAAGLHAKGYNVTVLEARARIGGRLHTVGLTTEDAKIDLGAAWIHGVQGNPIMALAMENGLKTIMTIPEDEASYLDSGQEVPDGQEVKGDDLLEQLSVYIEEDEAGAISINTTLQQALDAFSKDQELSNTDNSLLVAAAETSIVQEYAASLSNLSAQYYSADEQLDGGDALFPGGYIQIAQAVARGVPGIQLEHQVTKIVYGEDQVTVSANSPQGPVTLTANAVVVTLPLGVLKKHHSSMFQPALPADKAAAISRLGMGLLDKVILVYDEVFWDNEVSWIARMPTSDALSSQRFKAFFNVAKYIPSLPVLVAFNAGNPAWVAEDDSNTSLATQAHTALKVLFPEAPAAPKEVLVTRWGQDPYSLGSYSVKPPGSSPEDVKALAAPVGGRLFFAGEATSVRYPSTVHGAYLSGMETVVNAVSNSDKVQKAGADKGASTTGEIGPSSWAQGAGGSSHGLMLVGATMIVFAALL